MSTNEDQLKIPAGCSEPTTHSPGPFQKAIWLIIILIISLLIYVPSIRRVLFTSPNSIIGIYVSNMPIIFVSLFIVLLPSLLFHEKAHQIASSSMGYESVILYSPIYHFNEPFNYIVDSWVPEKEYNIILIAPLVFVNFVMSSILITSPFEIIDILATTFLIVNTATSSNDIRMLLLNLYTSDRSMIRHQVEDNSLVVYRCAKNNR